MRAKGSVLAGAGHYTGIMVTTLGILMLVPLLLALLGGEWASAVDFVTGAALTLGAGIGLMLLLPRREITWAQGLAAAAGSWLLGMVVGAVPLYLSGHYGSYLDAAFDAMSALTTTGLTLIRDPEHAPNALHMWRSLMGLAGGQGIVAVTIAILARHLPGAHKLYAGEGREERLLPGTSHTARAIIQIALWFLAVGIVVFTAALLQAGLAPYRAFLHGLWLLLGSWSTGGMLPVSQRLLYYHSAAVEVAVLLFALVGTLNFQVHWAMLTGKRREIGRNLETITFAITAVLLTVLGTWELARNHVFGGDNATIALFRKGVFQVLSAHTTAGFMTVMPGQLATWGPLSLAALALAMLFGGSVSSTAGGIKALRIGIGFKTVAQDVKRVLAPDSAVVMERYHLHRPLVLEDRQARAALTIVVLYILLWAFNTVAAAAYSYPLVRAMVEAASVVGNAGLTTGIVGPAMPHFLKLIYIGSMWLGRLEFFSVFVLIGLLLRGVRRR